MGDSLFRLYYATDTQKLYQNVNSQWVFIATIRHGLLTELDQDQHPQYLNNNRHDKTERHVLGTVVPHDDHNNLSNKGNKTHQEIDDHIDNIDGSAHGINTLISQHKHDGQSGSPSKINLISEVQGTLPLTNLVDSVKVRSVSVPVGEIPAGSVDEIPLWVVPIDCIITKILIIPKTDIVGADIDNMTLSVIRKDTDIDIVTKTFDSASGTSGSFSSISLGEPSLDLLQGTVLSFKKTESGVGMNMPQLTVVVEWKPK